LKEDRDSPARFSAARVRVNVAAIVAITAACQIACSQPTSPAPLPVDPNAPVAGAHTGQVTIDYVGANVVPGSTVTGCGPTIAGCAARLRLSFRLRSVGAGTVLFSGATLHGSNKAACLSAVGDGFALAANAIVTVDLVFDQFNASCALPFDVTNMAVTIEGTVEVASRQEFAIRYRFTS
jgi:hypothetical protein